MKLHYNRAKAEERGFTLLEALLAAMLIGLVVAALAVSSGAFTVYSAAGVDISTAEFLIEEIRELTAPAPFVDLGVYDAVSRCPPIDAEGSAMQEFAAYRQDVSVEYVGAGDLTQAVDGPTDFYRLTVAVTKNGRPISSASWIRAKY